MSQRRPSGIFDVIDHILYCMSIENKTLLKVLMFLVVSGIAGALVYAVKTIHELP